MTWAVPTTQANDWQTRYRFALPALVVLWSFVVLSGLAVLWNYESMPGDWLTQPEAWPVASTIDRCESDYTLVMFAHPRCPCTRASIRELEVLMTRVAPRVEAIVMFLSPQGVAHDWHQTDLWRHVAAIPNASPAVDHNGSEAALFGAQVSGHVELFDRLGRRVFSGGITVSRGHEGDNEGRASIESLVLRGEKRHAETFVYGCALHETLQQAAGTKLNVN